MNQLERVARAIVDAIDGDTDEWRMWEIEAKAAVNAVRPKWQPIETAPKDGSTILVWFVPHGALSVFWEDDIWCISNQKCDPLPVRGYRTGEDTHWMPLPEPPK